MGTRALVGHYTKDGSWRAVWVHYDATPESLGADLVHAVALHGGEIQPVLDHVFSTHGWTSWPAKPHHPEDPDDVIFTPENVFYDFHWFFLFDLDGRRMDVIPADEAFIADAQVYFAPDGPPDRTLGASGLTIADLRPVRDSWSRVCAAKSAALLETLFGALDIASAQIGIGVDPGRNGQRILAFGSRACAMQGSGSARDAFFSDGQQAPFPEFTTWFAERGALWTALQDTLGLTLHVDEDGLWQLLDVVEQVDDSRLQMGLEDARAMDPDVEPGDQLRVNLEDQSRLAWHWLFERVWSLAEPKPAPTAQT